MKLITIKKTEADDTKKMVAVVCKCKGPSICEDKDKLKIKFGSKNSTTYLEGATEKTKENYIKRHQVNEDWNNVNPGSLSRYILWNKRNLNDAINFYKKKFKC